MCCTAHPAKAFGTVVPKPKGLHQPLPVPPHLEEGCTASQDTSEATPVVGCSEARAVMPPPRCSTVPESIHAPSKNTVEHINGVEAFAAAVAQETLRDRKKKESLAPGTVCVRRYKIPSGHSCRARLSDSLTGAVADTISMKPNREDVPCRLDPDLRCPPPHKARDPDVALPAGVRRRVLAQTILKTV